MKKIKYLSWFIFVYCLIGSIFCSCENTDSASAPPASNLMATIGGKSMTFNANTLLSNNTIYIIGNGNYQLQLYVVKYNPNYIGSYKLANNSGASYYESYPNGRGDIFDYFTDSTHTGILNITSYNPTYQTISGNFSFTALQTYPLSDSGKYTISVTNGTFFINLK